MMKTKKKGLKSLALLLALILAIGFSPVTNVEAKAAPRLNYKKVTLVQGKKKRLKVRNLKKGRKVKWYSTKKSVATVNKKGIVKAKKKGKAYIVAKVGKKKYRCKVTVKKKTTKKKSSKKTTTKKPTGSVKKQLPGGKYATRIIGYYGDIYFKVGKTEDMFNYLENAPKNISANIKARCYKWYSSNANILSINKYGVATPKKAGTVKVSCKYQNRYGEWFTTKSTKIIVKNAGNVKISYTTFSSTDDKNTFDTIICTVKNNSDEAIEFDKYVYVDCGYNWRFTNNTNKLTLLKSGESVILEYKATDLWSNLWGKYVPYSGGASDNNPWTIEFGYKLHGNWISPVYDLNTNSWTTK